MPCYVFFSRDRRPDARDLDLIAAEPGVTVIDDSAGRALLVETNAVTAQHLSERLPGWVVREEAFHPRPGLRRSRPRGGGIA